MCTSLLACTNGTRFFGNDSMACTLAIKKRQSFARAYARKAPLVLTQRDAAHATRFTAISLVPHPLADFITSHTRTKTKMSAPLEVKLPDLFSVCYFAVSLHPQYQQVALESNAWVGAYQILGPDTCAFFTRINTPLLGAYVYTYATYDKLRIACDLINMLFSVDELSDDQDGVAAHSTMELYVRALLGGRTQRWLGRITDVIVVRFTFHFS
ncbi:hypothetical protein EW145_g1023 [Phellinidium pouzarii]|uniref:Uncharacterized protein n=1 Tax=Phellinidium pouzarii TaxID=167371 RepID=A0A4S4LG46_9AGAM|nr:hypothetical protein EW145_g1023 [Phellinidium pouzarii]